MRKLQISEEELEKAIVLYKSGKPLRKLAKEVKLSEEGLRKILSEKGILRSNHEARRLGKSPGVSINDNALDILTPEALYWIGFLYADGHLAKDRPRIVLGLSEIDKDHVQKFVDFFGEGIKIFKSDEGGKDCLGYKSNAAWRGQFSSQRIYNRLIELGIKPRKTYDLIPHEYLKHSRDFWRGVIDGDGSISENINIVGGKSYPIPVLSLCGVEATIVGFLDYVKSLGIQVNATLSRSNRSSVLCSTNLRAKDLVINTLNILYKDATVYLDRKYEKYLELINKNQQ